MKKEFIIADFDDLMMALVEAPKEDKLEIYVTNFVSLITKDDYEDNSKVINEVKFKRYNNHKVMATRVIDGIVFEATLQEVLNCSTIGHLHMTTVIRFKNSIFEVSDKNLDFDNLREIFKIIKRIHKNGYNRTIRELKN